MVLYTIDTSSAFAISPESVALQTAAIGSKISDVRESALKTAHIVSESALQTAHALGESFQTTVNGAVDRVNTASASAAATFNQGFESAQNTVQGAVQSTQQAVNNTVQRAAEAMQTAAAVVLTPFRVVREHVSDNFVLISDRLYEIVRPYQNEEVLYVPVPESKYVNSGVPGNHHVSYKKVVHPYAYESGGVEEYLAAGSEKLEKILVPEAPKEGKANFNHVHS